MSGCLPGKRTRKGAGYATTRRRLRSMSIRVLIKHLEEQVSHKDGSAPNAEWILNELKKYMKSRNLIDDLFFTQELMKMDACQWCGTFDTDKVSVHIDESKCHVCPECATQYLDGSYEVLKEKVRKHGKG